MESTGDVQEFYPLYAQKKAQHMWSEDKSISHRKITFLLITPVFTPAECEWVDPHMGLFAIKEKKEKGVMHVSDVPEGSLFLNTRYESEGD
jgi:hypothetical protein